MCSTGHHCQCQSLIQQCLYHCPPNNDNCKHRLRRGTGCVLNQTVINSLENHLLMMELHHLDLNSTNLYLIRPRHFRGKNYDLIGAKLQNTRPLTPSLNLLLPRSAVDVIYIINLYKHHEICPLHLTRWRFTLSVLATAVPQST